MNNLDPKSNTEPVELEKMRQEALERANHAYYNPDSVHYRDNKRYSWAVQTINKKYDELKSETV